MKRKGIFVSKKPLMLFNKKYSSKKCNKKNIEQLEKVEEGLYANPTKYGCECVHNICVRCYKGDSNFVSRAISTFYARLTRQIDTLTTVLLTV